jgi:antitoxin component of MazEF toxin-antitoxin module
MLAERKIYDVSGAKQIRLPSKFVKKLNIVINEVVNVELKDDKIIISKKLKEVE